MSIAAWNLIKSTKHFNVSIYRRLGRMIVYSMMINVVLCFWISHMYFNRPENAYYATNGASPPMQIKALAKPNMSSVPLLANDPGIGIEVKPIPE